MQKYPPTDNTLFLVQAVDCDNTILQRFITKTGYMTHKCLKKWVKQKMQIETSSQQRVGA